MPEAGGLPVEMRCVNKQLGIFADATKVARDLSDNSVRHAPVISVILDNQSGPNLGGGISGP
jgi:hypothetical protein